MEGKTKKQLIEEVESLRKQVAELEQAKEALWKSLEEYKSLVNNVKLGIFRSTPGPFGRFFEVNPAMEEITGYSREELLQMDVSDLYVRPEERQAVLEEIASKAGKTTRELSLRKKDGSEILVSDTKVAVRDDTGKVLYFDGIIEDTTRRKRAEEKLRKAEEDWRSSFNSLEDVMLIIDKDYNLENINDSGLALLGKSREEV